MIIAIVSGKGGTGKATMSVVFVLSIDESIQLLDCDKSNKGCFVYINKWDISTEISNAIKDIKVKYLMIKI